jgi:hypothetical protein
MTCFTAWRRDCSSRALLAEPLPSLGIGGRKWAYEKGRFGAQLTPSAEDRFLALPPIRKADFEG